MARPNVTRVNQRVQVQADLGGTPDYKVQEPIALGSTESAASKSWAQLQGLLGVATPLAKQYNDDQTQQGMADARLGKEDQKRMQRVHSYAEGVAKAHTIVQTQDALAKIEALAAESNIHDLSPQEKMAWADAQMHKELGPLAEDPQARLVIADMYSDWATKFAGTAVREAQLQNQATVQDAFSVKIAQAIGGGSVDFGALANEGAAVFPGGRSEAWQNIVEQTAQYAEEHHDETILDLLPAKVKTEDGQTIDSPILAAQNKARLTQARYRISQWQEQVGKPQFEYEKAQWRRPWEDMAERGEPITLPQLKAGFAPGYADEGWANSIINKANTQREALLKKQSARSLADQFRKDNGGLPWHDLADIPGGDISMEKAQEYVNEDYAGLFQTYAQGKGIEVPLTGNDLKKHPELLAEVMNRSKVDRLGYEPLKHWMTDINPAMGATVIDRLDTYRLAKARGLESMYVPTAEQQAIFEVALASTSAGEKPEQTIQTIQRLADPAVQDYMKANRKVAEAGALTGDWDVTNKWFDANTADISNLPYVQNKVKGLADLFLSRGLSPQKAAEKAHSFFADTHFAVNVNGSTLMVPQSRKYDSAAAATALEAAGDLAEEYAAKEGDPNPKAAHLAVVFGRNGKGTEVYFLGSDGLELNAKPLTIPALIAQMHKAGGSNFQQRVLENRVGQDRRRESVRDPYKYLRSRIHSAQ